MSCQIVLLAVDLPVSIRNAKSGIMLLELKPCCASGRAGLNQSLQIILLITPYPAFHASEQILPTDLEAK